jgi:hypothetical protein
MSEEIRMSLLVNLAFIFGPREGNFVPGLSHEQKKRSLKNSSFQPVLCVRVCVYSETNIGPECFMGSLTGDDVYYYTSVCLKRPMYGGALGPSIRHRDDKGS